MKKRGYTIVEMLVVLAIIALMVAIVVPRFAVSQKGVALKGAATEVMSALRTARRLAITERVPHAVIFNLDVIPTEYFVAKYDRRYDPPGGGPCGYTEPPPFDSTDVYSAGPPEFKMYTNWELVGETRRLPENIVVTDIRKQGENLNVKRTEDTNLNGTVEASEDTGLDDDDDTKDYFNCDAPDPGEGNVSVSPQPNPVARIIEFQPTGTADKAIIHLWNMKEERREIPTITNLPKSLVQLGYPPGMNPAGTPTQTNYFTVPTPASPEDVYYYTVVVNPVTGGVMVYDYAWGDAGAGDWDRKKDGS